MVICYDDLSKLREKRPDKKIVFCSGTFDLFHAGHVIFLENCKSLGDILVVAVGTDEDIRNNKNPQLPILGQDLRLRVVDAMRAVDYSFFSNPSKKGEHWLLPIEEIFLYFKPDVWAVNDDGDIEKRRGLSKRWDVPLEIFHREFPISTSAIIKKIRGLM